MTTQMTRVAHLPDRSVRYLEAGGGKPIVLLHAFPLSADQWVPQLSRAPRGVHLIAPDLRGFRGAGPAYEQLGLSTVTMDEYAADVLSLMTHLEIDKAAVAGVSMGGYVAFAMLRRAPARVTALLLANTRAIADSDEARAGRDRMIALAEREGPAAIAREMVPRLLGATTRRDQPDLADAVAHMIAMNSTEAIVAALRALRARPDSTPLLPSIDVPVTVVTGDEDAIVPIAETDAMRRAIPRARMTVLPRTGHLANLEAPEAFQRDLGDLFK